MTRVRNSLSEMVCVSTWPRARANTNLTFDPARFLSCPTSAAASLSGCPARLAGSPSRLKSVRVRSLSSRGVTRLGLEGMAHRVAQIEHGSQTGFTLVEADDPGFDADRATHDLGG